MTATEKQWLERVEYDMDTARAMLKMRKYLYVVFLCQQAVEKGLKAILAKQGRRIPLIHALRKLAVVTEIEKELNDEQIDLLEGLTPFAIKARYGDYKKRLSEICDRSTASNFLKRTEEFIKWLEKRM